MGKASGKKAERRSAKVTMTTNMKDKLTIDPSEGLHVQTLVRAADDDPAWSMMSIDVYPLPTVIVDKVAQLMSVVVQEALKALEIADPNSPGMDLQDHIDGPVH